MLSRLIMATWKNMSYLHIAQKNSIAKQVASILSNGTKRTGQTISKYNPVFLFQRDQNPHTFSSVRGHIFDYQLPPECKSWQNYDNSKILNRLLPMVKKPGPDMEDLIRNIEKIAVNKKYLVLWLDCDRQGEAIAFEVIQLVKRVNPAVLIKRARFSAVTRVDIMNAWQNLVDPNQLQADAVNYRIEMDFRMGCAFTRYQTVAFSKKYRLKQHSVISYGPCQIPTLGFVVQRYLEIKYFKPEKYWVIKASIILDQSTSVELKWQKTSTRDQIQANLMLYTMMQKADRGNGLITGKILARNKNQKKKYRPYPLTTVAFQKLATDKLKISSAQAMKIAEKLYQQGFISYPRTETNAFPHTMNLNNLVQRLKNCNSYQSYVEQLLNGKFMKPKVGKQNDQAHSPIHPVKPADPSTLSGMQWRVYDLISRHFLACCSKDAVGIQSQIIAEIGEQRFKASHITIKQKNYLQIYPFDRWNQGSFPGEIPEEFNALVELSENKTKPPGYLTESDLIGLMQKNQIGTDATIHEHIETIQNRKYAIKNSNTFRPTNLGASLIITYKALGLHLQDCNIRRMIQQRMDKIALGEIQKNKAALDTLSEVTPLYQKLKNLQQTWLEQMGVAMQQNQELRQVQMSAGFGQTQNQNQERSNLQTDDQSNIQNPTTNTFSRIVCFICNEPGHVSTVCPNKNKPKSKQKQYEPKRNYEGAVTTNTIVCYHCKEPGHLTSNCPERQGPKRQGTQFNQTARKFVCFICNQQGHFAPNCPNKHNSSRNVQENNNARTLQRNDDKKPTCYSCGQAGHFSTNCPNKGKTTVNAAKQKEKKSCSSCGVVGRHPNGSNCPNVVRKRQKGNDNGSNEEE